MLSPSTKYIVLLPYEKELIAELGFTEQEYRWFIKECSKRSGVQPVGPQALEPFTIGVILLTIGTLLSAAASFFKPKQSGGGGGIRQNTDQGQNVVNRTEFAPKAGFDSLQNVVELGSTIPLVYANRETVNGVIYGGVRVNTNLLWSQMMSFGGNQMLRAIYLISEGEISPLDVKQFAFGENVLGSYDLGAQVANESSARMTFYVRRNGGRLLSTDRVAGRSAGQDPGNASNAGGADVFSIRGMNNQWTTDFCYTYKPSTQTKFGVHSLIGAGLCHRVNPAMRPAVSAQTEPADNGKRIRIKCSTDDVGRAQRLKYNERFSTYSGYVSVNGVPIGSPSQRTLNINDILTYELSSKSDAKKTFTSGKGNSKHVEKCSDVAQTVAGLQRAWDDSINIGELYKVGSAHVICESRSPTDEIFVSEATQEPIGGGKRITATFRVVKAGLARLDKAGTTSTFRVATNTGHLLKLSIASFSLPRAAQVIEIGFKSVQGIRISGLCNFRDTLSHREIDGRACEFYKGRKYSTNQTLTLSNYTSGGYSGSETRYSFFRLGFRVAGSNDNFTYMSQCFGFRGLTQQNAFNYIRLQMPSFQAWEYVLEPISGYELRQGFHGNSLEVLDSKLSTFKTVSSAGVTAYYNGISVARNSRVFQMPSTQRNKDLGVQISDGGDPGRSSSNDYADTWGRAAEAFPFQEIQSSAGRGPEHEIAYVNIITPNPTTPTYGFLATIGCNIRSSTEFQQLKQLSVYVSGGCGGSVHTFPEVFLDLLTNARYGVGSILSGGQIDASSIVSAANWNRSRKYFWDGTLDKPVNIRNWASETADFFLLDVVIKNGKWGLQPSFYFDQPEVITNLFTSGNIIEDSFEFVYADLQQRNPKRVSVKWRHERPNNTTNTNGIFPMIREVNVRESTTPEDAQLQTFDLTDFCTNQAHAIDVAKFICRKSRLETNTIRFKTVPTKAALQVGRCFKLGVETVQYLQPNNGVIDGTGLISSITPLSDGSYDVLIWDGTTSSIEERTLVVQGQRATSINKPAVFCLRSSVVDTVAYKVKSMSFDEDGNLQVEANVFPLTSSGYALIAQDWDNPASWIIDGQIEGSQNNSNPGNYASAVYITGPDTLYVNDEETYEAVVSGSGSITGYSWFGGVAFGTPTESSTTITRSSPGSVTIGVTVMGVTSYKDIEFIEAPTAISSIGAVTIVGPVSVAAGYPVDYSLSYPSELPAIAASSIQPEDTYQIAFPGSTDFTLIGAENSLYKTVFEANAPGSGSGFVYDMNNVFLAWDIGGTDESSAEMQNSSAPITTVLFDKTGTYTISCVVSSPSAVDSPQIAVLTISVVASVITVVATDPDLSEAQSGETQNPGLFTLTRTGIITNPLTVNVQISGTAIPGTDYTVIPTVVTFLAGAATATVPISVIYDTEIETAETVVMTIVDGAGYDIGTTPVATAFITDNSRPTVSIFPVSVGITGNTISFALTRTGVLSGITDVPYLVSGTTVNPALAVDFVGNALPSGVVQFAANETVKTLSIATSPSTTNYKFLKSFNVLLGTPTGGLLSSTNYAALGMIFTESSASAANNMRSSTSVTINCAANATVTGSFVLPKSCVIISIAVSQGCWFRLYNSILASSSDSSRLRTVAPGLAAGVIADPVLPGAVTLNFEPAPVAMNRETVPGTTYPFRLTNDSVTGDILITLTYLSLEA